MACIEWWISRGVHWESAGLECLNNNRLYKLCSLQERFDYLSRFLFSDIERIKSQLLTADGWQRLSSLEKLDSGDPWQKMNS